MRCPVAAAMGLSIAITASSAHGIAVFLHRIHLGDFFFERASGQLHAEDAGFESPVFFVEAGRTTVFTLVVALDAVVRVIQGAGEIGAGIGELEAFAVTPMIMRELELDQARGFDFFPQAQGGACRACGAF